jgi:hypothetical protein
MKGLEFKMVYMMIMILVVIAIAVVIIFYPMLTYGQTVTSKRDFEQFCVFWGMYNYNPAKDVVEVNGVSYNVDLYCETVLRTGTADRAACAKCCKKEIVC